MNYLVGLLQGKSPIATLPGPGLSDTVPTVDIVGKELPGHKTTVHISNFLIYALPAFLFRHDTARAGLIAFYTFSAAQALFEMALHLASNRLHIVHAFKFVPLFVAQWYWLIVKSGAAAAVHGPKDFAFVIFALHVLVVVPGLMQEFFITLFPGVAKKLHMAREVRPAAE